MKDKTIMMYDHICSSADVDPWATTELKKVLDAYLADGCSTCAFESVDEWEMPCRKCKRNCKDYWRKTEYREERWKIQMTKEEAIKVLKPFRDCMVDQYGCPISDVVYALDIALETLEQNCLVQSKPLSYINQK